MRRLYEAYWIARQIRREKKSSNVRVIRRQIRGAEAWSFAWRLGVGVLVMPVALAVCCTLIGLPLGLYLMWLGCKPLNNYLKWNLETRMAAAEAAEHPEIHRQKIRGYYVQVSKEL
jgi:hypothetical protein